MIAFQILERNSFMHKLLATDCFDSFLLEEASVSVAVTHHIDGRLNQTFFTAGEWEDASLRPYEFMAWKDIRSLCFDLIKGKRTPVGFRFVLHLMPEYIAPLLSKADTAVSPQQIKAFVLNVKYDGSVLTLVSGTALTTFLPDKSPDQIWDNALKQFLYKKEIAVQEL